MFSLISFDVFLQFGIVPGVLLPLAYHRLAGLLTLPGKFLLFLGLGLGGIPGVEFRPARIAPCDTELAGLLLPFTAELFGIDGGDGKRVGG